MTLYADITDRMYYEKGACMKKTVNISAVALHELLMAGATVTVQQANDEPVTLVSIPDEVLTYLTDLAYKHPERRIAQWFGNKENLIS